MTPNFYLGCIKCSFREEHLSLSFETLLTHLRNPTTKCPHCQSRMERLLTSANVRIQGGTEKFYTGDKK